MLSSPSDETTKHLTRLTDYISQVIAKPARLGTLSRQRARGELLHFLSSHSASEGESSPTRIISSDVALPSFIPPLPQAGEGWGEGQ